MATVVRHELLGCDGFRVESQRGLLGWVEEAWLGSSQDPAALAIRTLDGRRGLLLAEDVEVVHPDSELVLIHEEGRLLELDVPRMNDGSSNGLAASWTTTGRTLEPPSPPGLLQRALLTMRPWRLAPPPRHEAERPIWQTVAMLYICLALIVGLVTGLAFLAAGLFG